MREAAAGIMFAARWCGDLPELLLARTVLEDKFGSDFAAMAKEGTGIVDPMVCITNCVAWSCVHNAAHISLIWKLELEKVIILTFCWVGLCCLCSWCGRCPVIIRQTWS